MDRRLIKKVRVENLEPNTRLTHDILSTKQTVLLRSGTILKQEFIDKLKSWGVRFIYTVSEQFKADRELADADLIVADFLAENKRALTEELGLAPVLGTAQVEALAATAESLYAKLLQTDSASLDAAFGVASELFRLLPPVEERLPVAALDTPVARYFIYHAISSSVLFAALLKSEGLAEEQVVVLTVGALLRDVGQLQLPAEILNKPGPLTPEEFGEVRKHPTMSATMLNQAGGLAENALMLVVQHHERWDGKGYPSGFENGEIVAEAQLLSVCDAYDAMCSNRPHAQCVSPYQALTTIISLSGRQFSQLAINRFIRKYGLYPVGTVIRLSDNTYSVVTQVNEGKPTYPVVQVVLDEKLQQVKDGPVIDLSSESRLFAVKVYSI